MLITIRVRAPTDEDVAGSSVVVAERHHLSGYPVTLDDRAAGDAAVVVARVRDWLAEFERSDPSPPT
ncbi:MAG: hypothetical protein ABWZ52_10740 [Acidimicrobiales bacterium]